MPEYDVIVVGAGHNGLTAAAYLAKHGLRVAVFERNEFIGGGVVTREVTLPGFKHDLHSTAHGAIQANPMIAKDELGLLSKYGLRYVYPEAIIGAPYRDGRSIVLYRDVDKSCKSIEQVSKKDARAYRKLFEWCHKTLGELAPTFQGPPASLGETISMMEKTEDGLEVVRMLLMSGLKVLEEWFEHEYVIALIGKLVAEFGVALDDNGNGLYVPMMLHRLGVLGWGLPVGGSGVLAETLGRCIEDLDGEIFTNSMVSSILTRSGLAIGVELADGRTALARKAVVADVHIRQLPGLVGEEALGNEFVRKVKRTRPNTPVPFLAHYALNDAPKYRNGGDMDRTFLVELIPSLEALRRHFDDIKYGIPSPKEHCNPLLVCQTIFDPTRAPPGKHVLYAYEFVPYNLKAGGAARWDEVKEDVEATMLDMIRDYTTNMGEENILGRYLETPLSIERRNPSMMFGSAWHLESVIYQLMSLRPIPGYGNFRTPLSNLYLAGPSSPTGGAVTGGGRVTAQVVLHDLGILKAIEVPALPSIGK